MVALVQISCFNVCFLFIYVLSFLSNELCEMFLVCPLSSFPHEDPFQHVLSAPKGKGEVMTVHIYKQCF